MELNQLKRYLRLRAVFVPWVLLSGVILASKSAQPTNKEEKNMIRSNTLGMITLSLSLFFFLLFPYHGMAQTFPKVACSDAEITVPSNGSFVVIDTNLTSSSLSAGSHSCITTFSTELATSSGTVLAELAYSSASNPTPATCRNDNIGGPILTQVNGGFDETHTFVNPSSVFVHQSQAPGTLKMRPCMRSGNGAYRLRRHCLTLQCK